MRLLIVIQIITIVMQLGPGLMIHLKILRQSFESRFRIRLGQNLPRMIPK